ncbi:MAG: alanine--tRNA ligase [Oscillospiraceae bacterium]|nr:alanine--tRNA ligase [Oscillospiraceae bacterium]
MKYFGLNELRKKFLDFFASKEHLILDSFPLVPINDKSLLIISAGMAPLKPYFSGEQTPPGPRAASCQKCVRVNDIDNVGKTSRHCTFFEMLGNFSFGDYFKKESITWSWEFLTRVLGIPEELLFPSVYIEDDEAFGVWVNDVGLPPEKISKLGKEHNFWEIEGGTGPCGPSSEIYFDRGKENGCDEPDCAPGCDCDRFIEVWNNVFTQFDSDGKGNYTPLEKKNIDTGMGLERLAMVMQQAGSVFEVDTIKAIIDKICMTSGIKYNSDEKNDISIRIISDHIRSAAFMTGDNIAPSNEGRGYVLRRILRRAARHGKLLGIKGAFLCDLCDVVIDLSKEAYPELEQKRGYIKRVIKAEEDRFEATIDSGLEILQGMIKKSGKVLSGENIFKLYDTFGFPYDLTLEICEEQGLALDKDGFDRLMAEQVKRAREARADVGGWSKDRLAGLKNIKTEFKGYTHLYQKAKITAIFTDDGETLTETGSINEGECIIILDKTPFYAESGGQIGDIGWISEDAADLARPPENRAYVSDCKKTADGTILHICRIETGEIKTGDSVCARVDDETREAIMRNHTAAHLLQAALRKVLGVHVEQSGSYVDAERLRFDFTHFAAVSADELGKIEWLINRFILWDCIVTTKETDMETAKKMGALALFGEKYGESVRVVTIDSMDYCLPEQDIAGQIFSAELCGGTHAESTGKIGLFKIISESSIAAGVRRIEAVTGFGVLELIEQNKTLISNTAKILKVNNPNDIDKKSESLINELKEAKRETEKLTAKLAAGKLQELQDKAVKINNINFITAHFDDINADGAKFLCEQLKDSDASVAAVIAATAENKLTFTAVCGADAVKAGANAGVLVKQIAQITGGGGGGKPEFAVAGGRDLNKLGEALSAGEKILRGMVDNV